MKRLLLAVAGLLLAGCQFSLAGDVTPPPAAAEPEATSAPVDFPGLTPDPQTGAALYTQNCAPCHGATGLGDGPQSNALPFAPAPIGSQELAAASAPADWYQIVTNGNLERYMPPFAARLSGQERWDMLAYVYSLSASQEALQRGSELAGMHADEIDSIFTNLNDLTQMASFSQNDISAQLQPELPSLSADDLRDLAIFVQNASLAGGLVSEPVHLGETGSFSGSVVDGTDGNLPPDLQAILFGYDHATQAMTLTAPVNPDGSFMFPEVPLAANRTYFVEVDYQGQSYFSEFLTPLGSDAIFEQPITIYETSTDTSQLATETLTLVLDFTDAGTVRVVEQFVISNIGNRAVAPGADGQPVLFFNLPPNASNLVFQEGALGDRYVATENGFGDLRAVLPGQGSYQQLFVFDLPYNSNLDLPISVTLPTRSVVVLVPPGNVTVSDSDFQNAGTQEVQGATYQSYVSNSAQFAGDEISLHLSGANPAGSGAFAFLNDDRLLVGLGALAVAVGAVWVWLLRSQPANSENAIMDEIIRLDALYKKRLLSKRDYSRRRNVLKQQLRRILEKK